MSAAEPGSSDDDAGEDDDNRDEYAYDDDEKVAVASQKISSVPTSTNGWSAKPCMSKTSGGTAVGSTDGGESLLNPLSQKPDEAASYPPTASSSWSSAPSSTNKSDKNRSKNLDSPSREQTAPINLRDTNNFAAPSKKVGNDSSQGHDKDASSPGAASSQTIKIRVVKAGKKAKKDFRQPIVNKADACTIC